MVRNGGGSSSKGRACNGLVTIMVLHNVTGDHPAMMCQRICMGGCVLVKKVMAHPWVAFEVTDDAAHVLQPSSTPMVIFELNDMRSVRNREAGTEGAAT